MLSNGHPIDEQLGDGYTLLAVGTTSTDQQMWQDCADSIGLPLNIIAQECGHECDRYEMSWVLIRPDQFVAWTAPQPQIEASTIQSLLQHLKR